ncbi:protease inhibitor I9 family protein [Streptomyces sp. NPDC059496]|uniref:protease inhibitor I9 family protein n=1 Tax=Streptomyces sp. NPDC059496 TaxID=3346851 RepID=UPI0036CA4A7D
MQRGAAPAEDSRSRGRLFHDDLPSRSGSFFHASARTSGHRCSAHRHSRRGRSYIVSLDKKVAPAAFAKRLGLKAKFTYTKTINGFAAALTAEQLKSVRGAQGVTSVTQDATVTVQPTPRRGPGPQRPGRDGLHRRRRHRLPPPRLRRPCTAGLRRDRGRPSAWPAR